MDQCNGTWSSAPSMHARTVKQRTLTRLFHVLIRNRCLYPLPAALPAIRPTSKPFPVFLHTYSVPGNTATISSQKSYVALEAFGDVMMSTFGGVCGSSIKLKYAAKGSDARSAFSSSTCLDAEGCLDVGSIDGSCSRELSSVQEIFSAMGFCEMANIVVHCCGKMTIVTDLCGGSCLACTSRPFSISCLLATSCCF